jgi:hypothetical protein
VNNRSDFVNFTNFTQKFSSFIWTQKYLFETKMTRVSTKKSFWMIQRPYELRYVMRERESSWIIVHISGILLFLLKNFLFSFEHKNICLKQKWRQTYEIFVRISRIFSYFLNIFIFFSESNKNSQTKN